MSDNEAPCKLHGFVRRCQLVPAAVALDLSESPTIKGGDSGEARVFGVDRYSFGRRLELIVNLRCVSEEPLLEWDIARHRTVRSCAHDGSKEGGGAKHQITQWKFNKLDVGIVVSGFVSS